MFNKIKETLLKIEKITFNIEKSFVMFFGEN